MHKVREFSLLLVPELVEDVEVYDLRKDIRYNFHHYCLLFLLFIE